MVFGGLLLMLCTLFPASSAQVTYDVTCSDKLMKVTIFTTNEKSEIFIANLRGYTGCIPKTADGKTVVKFPLDNFHECGTTRMYSKFTGETLYYNHIIIEQPDKARESLLVKCVLPGNKTKLTSREKRLWRRNVLPEGFYEEEDLNITTIVARAPTPYLSLAIRQNGHFLDTAYNIQPGTPLEMIIYLDEKSSTVYGILASYLKVTDGTPEHDEVIVMNGCSIDPYIFGNFESLDHGNTVSSKFRAFKFPDSNYVLFVGTVSICIDQCRPVQCGNNQLSYGRRKREIPMELPYDPNKLYDVEMTTVLKVQFAPDHFKPIEEHVEGTYDPSQDKNVTAFRQTSGGSNWQPTLKYLDVIFWMLLMFLL